MHPHPILRGATLVAAAALLSACADRLPSEPRAIVGGPAMTVIPANAFTTLDAGLSHACALTSAGQAWCWGRNAGGQLGDSSASATTVPVQVLHPSGVTFTAITAGNSHSCAVAATSGQAYCWGYNADGRLGDSTTNLGLMPVAVKPVGAIAFASVSAGGQHSCGLNGSGQAYCWGYNGYGQIGDSTTTFAVTPVAVRHPAGVTFAQVAVGDKHSCALDTAGQAWCWGYGGDGSLGNNTTLPSRIPVAVTQPSGVTFASIATETNHVCGLTAGGQAYCWGLNGNGQLGDSTTTTRRTPVAVKQPSGVTFASVTTGGAHSCGVTSAGQEYCWGYNFRGQVGDGTTTQRLAVTAVSQPSGVTFAKIANGSSHSCGLDGVGQTWCWGRNDFNQLGDGSSTHRYTPVAVSH